MKKLKVVLIHGTWAPESSWTRETSTFYRTVAKQLGSDYQTVEHLSFEWSGYNRWRTRKSVAAFLNRVLNLIEDDESTDWDILIVAHSHAGNIATEAARLALKADPKSSIIGVVCLNTPFLKHEIRASSAYLFLWFVFGGLFLVAANGLGRLVEGEYETRFFERLYALTLSQLNWTLSVCCAFILILMAWHVVVAKRYAKESEAEDAAARPKVLCLSCPDDEAITALGLTEGVANLPQLLTNPIAIVVTSIWIALAIWYSGLDIGHWQEAKFWMTQTRVAATAYALWLVVAFLGAIVGCIVVSAAFGLSRKEMFENLVSRVLVSYVPLHPADSSFRAIAEKGIKMQVDLLHSTIYRSELTFKEIGRWLARQRAQKHPPPRVATAPPTVDSFPDGG